MWEDETPACLLQSGLPAIASSSPTSSPVPAASFWLPCPAPPAPPETADFPYSQGWLEASTCEQHRPQTSAPNSELLVLIAAPPPPLKGETDTWMLRPGPFSPILNPHLPFPALAILVPENLLKHKPHFPCLTPLTASTLRSGFTARPLPAQPSPTCPSGLTFSHTGFDCSESFQKENIPKELSPTYWPQQSWHPDIYFQGPLPQCQLACPPYDLSLRGQQLMFLMLPSISESLEGAQVLAVTRGS